MFCSASIFCVEQPDFTKPVKAWLSGNEARFMSSLSVDRLFINKLTTPFSFMPNFNVKKSTAESSLWMVHYKIYNLLTQVKNIYEIAQKYGSGKFSVILKRARPAEWSLYVFKQVDFNTSHFISGTIRKAFHADLLSVLNLDAKRDLDLSARVISETKKLTDNEYRMFKMYISFFASLYPNSQSPKIISSFIKLAETRKFAKGIKDVLEPVTNKLATKTNSKENKDDPLAELAKIANMDSQGNTTNSSDTTMLEEPAEQSSEDMFNILE